MGRSTSTRCYCTRCGASDEGHERWSVNTENFDESGRIYLELADATPAEAALGMAVLNSRAC